MVLLPEERAMFITYDDLAGLAVCGAFVSLPFVLFGAVPPIFLFLLLVMFLTAICVGNQ
jgi:hypothetical protein